MVIPLTTKKTHLHIRLNSKSASQERLNKNRKTFFMKSRIKFVIAMMSPQKRSASCTHRQSIYYLINKNTFFTFRYLNIFFWSNKSNVDYLN